MKIPKSYTGMQHAELIAELPADRVEIFAPMADWSADATGLTTVHVSRVMKALRTEGLITLRDRLLIIHDWKQLSEAAEFDPIYLHLKNAPDIERQGV